MDHAPYAIKVGNAPAAHATSRDRRAQSRHHSFPCQAADQAVGQRTLIRRHAGRARSNRDVHGGGNAQLRTVDEHLHNLTRFGTEPDRRIGRRRAAVIRCPVGL